MATAGLFVACLWAGPAPAHSVPGEAAVDLRALHEYRSTTQHALIACGSPFSARQGWIGAANALRDYRSCVLKVRPAVAVKLDAAIRTLVAADCVAALRKYNVAFDKALLGIEPQPGESPLAYEQRQVFLFHTMAHAWGRFEIAESIAD
jgi:hypothetical protein